MAPGKLEGKAIVLVEDEYLIADVLRSALELEGARVLGPYPSVDTALKSSERLTEADVAVLDVNLKGGHVYPLVDHLMTQGIPVVLTTGYDADSIPSAYAHLPRLLKPILSRELVECIRNVIADAD
ncbi:response regulator [Dyella jiangningensis]|nr:response regulator [Dyella jiangningensis]